MSDNYKGIFDKINTSTVVVSDISLNVRPLSTKTVDNIVKIVFDQASATTIATYEKAIENALLECYGDRVLEVPAYYRPGLIALMRCESVGNVYVDRDYKNTDENETYTIKNLKDSIVKFLESDQPEMPDESMNIVNSTIDIKFDSQKNIKQYNSLNKKFFTTVSNKAKEASNILMFQQSLEMLKVLGSIKVDVDGDVVNIDFNNMSVLEAHNTLQSIPIYVTDKISNALTLITKNHTDGFLTHPVDGENIIIEMGPLFFSVR